MHTYIIAEIGQNHNGDMETARKLIDMAAMPIRDLFTGERVPGVDAVKFTKRDLDCEMSREMAEAPYDSPHSYGETYMEHRKALEFSNAQFVELEDYARGLGLDFIVTLCAPSCLSLLDYIHVDTIKIASRDVTNIPLLEAVGHTHHNVIISNGMCGLEEMRAALIMIGKNTRDVSILHCISQYPAAYKDLNLSSIRPMHNAYPHHTIGYSDHSIGIAAPVVAVAMGAKIIEKHITLDHKAKGSDHAGSLEPDGLWRMVRDIRNIEQAIGVWVPTPRRPSYELRQKLGRSLALKYDLMAGDVLTEDNLCMVSPGYGMPWAIRSNVIGKRAVSYVPDMTLIKEEMFR